jgi:hypothetical protein
MAVSKSSIAIDSFLEYFRDAKPYHTKLLEVIEEYNFTEDMCVLMCDSVDKEITIQNDPLCKLTGFGIDYDDECGYDAIDCCDLFDCTGGYGYIFDNSDLLVEETIVDKHDDQGMLIVSGNQLNDIRIPVKSVYSPTEFTLKGDATNLLDTHAIGIFVNVLQFEVVSNDSSTIRISGNYLNFIQTKSNFRIEGAETEYNGTFTILNSSYDVTNDETVITYSFFKSIPDNELVGFKLQFRNSNPNGGIYQFGSYSFNGTDTLVSIVNDTFTEINPDEIHLGSIQFRTGLRYPREVEIDTGIVPYHNILYSTYDYINNLTQVFVDENISSYTVGSDTIKLYGYFFGSGYEGNEECTKPKDTHVYSKLEEDLIIEIDDSLVPTPTPTPSISVTPSITPSPSATPTPTPTPTPSVLPETYFVAFTEEDAANGAIRSYKIEGGSITFVDSANMPADGDTWGMGSNAADITPDKSTIYFISGKKSANTTDLFKVSVSPTGMLGTPQEIYRVKNSETGATALRINNAGTQLAVFDVKFNDPQNIVLFDIDSESLLDEAAPSIGSSYARDGDFNSTDDRLLVSSGTNGGSVLSLFSISNTGTLTEIDTYTATDIANSVVNIPGTDLFWCSENNNSSFDRYVSVVSISGDTITVEATFDSSVSNIGVKSRIIDGDKLATCGAIYSYDGTSITEETTYSFLFSSLNASNEYMAIFGSGSSNNPVFIKDKFGNDVDNVNTNPNRKIESLVIYDIF